ncbi:MAG: serine hydrolase [Bacteroidota bacterium]
MRVFIPLLSFVLLVAQGIKAQNIQVIDNLLQAYNKNDLLDGAVLIAKGDDIIYENGFGHASLEYTIPNTSKTKFRIASMTKIFTATLILQLVDEGRINLNDKIGKYLKGLNSELGTSVSIKNLLQHTSGLEREYLSSDPSPKADFSTLELVQLVNTNTRFLFPPSDSLSYSNAGYVLLAGVIENVTKQRYREVLQESIFSPLEMHDSGYENSEKEMIPNLATGYRLRLGTYLNTSSVGVSWIRGNGGIYSTVGDLFRFDRALKRGQLLSKQSFELMFEKSFVYSSFAMQWQVFDSIAGFPKNSSRYALARGASPTGFRTQWITEVDGDFSVFILSNLDYCPRKEIAGKIFQALYNEKDIEMPRQSLAAKTLEILENADKETAIDFLSQQKQEEEQAVSLAINELMELGFHKIRAEQALSAVDLFSIADALFPNNPGILVSLSYAYLQSGKMEKARRLLDRVLQIAPEDSDAKEILAELQYFGF